ncbi:MAG: hypothetical protein ACE366_31815 [Bradymonadia bacterium]
MARRRTRKYNTANKGKGSATELFGVEGPEASPEGVDLTAPTATGASPDLDGAAADDWYDDEDDAPQPRGVSYSGLMMRHPLLLLFVIGLGVFTIIRELPSAQLFFADPTVINYGDLIERPQMRADGKEPPAFDHGVFCTLAGTVNSLTMQYQGARNSNGESTNTAAKYFVKIAGDSVFLIIAADREDVQTHIRSMTTLVGFGFEEQGRMINADHDPIYASTARTLRLHYNIKDDEPLWLFDTTDTPSAYRGHFLIVCFSGLVILVALFGLFRYWRRREA